MTRKPWQVTVTILALFAVPVLLAGCPKKPAPAAGGAPGAAGATAGGGVEAGPGVGGAAGAPGGVPGTGPGGLAGGPGGAAAGRPGGGPTDAGAGGVTGVAPGTIGGGPGTMGGGPGGLGGGPGTTAGGGLGPSAAPGALASGAMAGGPGPTTLGGGPGVAATGTTIPALPSPKEFVETSALRDIHFDFDRYEIRPQDAKVLDDNAQWLKQNASALVLIEGHADERGTNEYNLALGERRAKATRDHLISLGIDGGRITIISYGEERPLCTERTEACWAQNRRAHFLVKQ